MFNFINKSNNNETDNINIDNIGGGDNITNTYIKILNNRDNNIKKIFLKMITILIKKLTDIESEISFKKKYIIEKEKN